MSLRQFHPFLFVGISCTLAIGLSILEFTLGIPRPISALIATFGAFTACCGVITIARPVFRAGGYRAWLEKSRTIDLGHLVPTPEEIAEEREERKDALALQLAGPALVIIGTMINGISGFF